jgi:MscS family membrane protein
VEDIIKELMRLITIDWRDCTVAFIIFFIIYVFKGIIASSILKIIKKILGKKKEEHYLAVEKAFKIPLENLSIVYGLYLASNYLTTSPILGGFLWKVIKIAIIITVAYGLCQMESFYKIGMRKMNAKLKIDSSKIISQMMIKIIRVVIVLFAVAMVMGEFFDVGAFIAGLGIAGLAFALAAQDTLSNLVAGFAIIVDRPFDIGDWVECAGNEGAVEDISFRTTKIRTVSKEVINVPNSILASNPIKNFARRETRRINFVLGLTYSTTADQIRETRDGIENKLKSLEFVKESGIMVRFDNYGASSLDILINCFVETNSLEEYLRYKETVNFEVMNIMEAVGVSPAFPSTSVYFENQLSVENLKV